MDNKDNKTTLDLSAEAQDLAGYVADGWQIHYAPVYGGVGAWNGKTNGWFGVSFQAFSELKSSRIIEHTRTMNHGHGRFHGRVDIYKGKSS